MPRTRNKLPLVVQKRLKETRVARLATLNVSGEPHLVPICFAYDGKFFYTAIDQKRKRIPPERLARVQNIAAQPKVALLIDGYDEDWSQLWYILVRGMARFVPMRANRERASAIRKLKAKYPQYGKGMLGDDALVIRVTPTKITFWQNRQ